MDLHGVKASNFDGPLGRCRPLGGHLMNLVDGHGHRRTVRTRGAIQIGTAHGLVGAADGRLAAAHAWARRTARVPQLGHKEAALGMHGVRHPFPPGQLFVGKHARHARVG